MNTIPHRQIVNLSELTGICCVKSAPEDDLVGPHLDVIDLSRGGAGNS